MICKYGEMCSPIFPCHFHVQEAKLELQERRGRMPTYVTVVEHPVIRREVVYEDSSPGLSLLGAVAGGLLGGLIGSSRSERSEAPRRKALPAHKKSRK